MSLKAKLGLLFANWQSKKTQNWAKNGSKYQLKTFQHLISKAGSTQFGKDHHFDKINSYADFIKQVPIRDYEDLKPYIEKIKAGEENVLWPGRPIYLSKTSGTTSGAKYIPLTKESIPYHITAARNAILAYISETKKTDFINGKMIFLQGSPELDQSKKIPIGRLSGIVAHHVPAYLQKNRLPSFEINCIEDWEEKVLAISKATLNEKMTLISGIPPWVQMYFEKLLSISGKKTILEIFPKFSLFIYGGVNYEPYRGNMEKLIGGKVDSIELYPASEGFIAYQDRQNEEGLLLLLNGGIFYEFIPSEEFFNENPRRLMVSDVQLGVNYVIIINSNAGLWGYNIGDTIKFVSLNPFRIVVTGRIKHYTSAFGEHLIAEEVEKAIQFACAKTETTITEFHLAPQVNPKEGELPYHEWFIEFKQQPKNLDAFNLMLDHKIQDLNPYYKDLIEGKILQQLKIKAIKEDGFMNYMKGIGKLGGQNKLPRLSNDRKIAEQLIPFLVLNTN